jgi:hypothetical protein
MHKKNDIDNISIDIDIICGFNEKTFATDIRGSVWTAALQTLPGRRNVQETTRPHTDKKAKENEPEQVPVIVSDTGSSDPDQPGASRRSIGRRPGRRTRI